MSVDFDHNKMMEGLESAVEKSALEEGLLDVKGLVSNRLNDLRKFKEMRQEMHERKLALERAIKIMDKRIEMSLNDIKTLQMPL